MNSNTRSWGVTILRLWFGLLIALQGYRELPPHWDSLWSLGLSGMPAKAYLAFAASGLRLLVGTALFLGIAVRIAALFAAAAAALAMWRAGAVSPESLLDHSLLTTMFIVSLAFILLGPGRLNVGALIGRRR